MVIAHVHWVMMKSGSHLDPKGEAFRISEPGRWGGPQEDIACLSWSLWYRQGQATAQIVVTLGGTEVTLGEIVVTSGLSREKA